MVYLYETQPKFNNNFKRLTRKDKVLKKRIYRKMMEICNNPYIGKPMRNVLKGTRRVHIGHIVIVYEVIGEVIFFLNIDHHDKSY